MDDPESEWEIQESSGGNSDNGKLNWMLRLGRKILVTGIVISSAPVVLPPIMAISAIGLICSVPYGVFLVSYACTKTVMRRLLPMASPSAPLLLEYRKVFNGEEEANGDENQGGQNEELKGDTIEEVEIRVELVEKENEELDKGNTLQKGAYQKGGVESDGKKSVEEVYEIVEENGYEEDGGEFLDQEEERASERFEEEVKEITELKVEHPIIEGSRSEQPADKSHGIEAVLEGDNKHCSDFEKQMEAENVKEKEELVREMRQGVENVDAWKKPEEKAKLKFEGTTKGRGEQSIKESVNEQPGEIHGFLATVEGDKKEGDNVNKQTTAELKNVAVHVENDELVRKSRVSLDRNRKEGRSRDAAEDEQGEEKAQVDAKVKILRGNEGTMERKQEQPVIEESLGEQPLDSDVLGGLEGSEKKESNMEETPVEVKNVPVQLIQAIDVEKNEKIIGARGLSKRIRDERETGSEMDDKQIAERVNVGGAGEQSKEMEVKIEGTKEVKEEEYVGDGSTSEPPIEMVCDIAVEFEGDEKNSSNMEKETPVQVEKVDVQLSQSTDIEEDEELVRETRGLLEKIRDDGKTSFADDKQSTEKEHVGTEKDDKKIVGKVEKANNRCILAHDEMGKPASESETKVEENRAKDRMQMKGSVEILDAFSKETKPVKDSEGLFEEMDVDYITRKAQSVGPVSGTVNDNSSIEELTVESTALMEGGQGEDDNENNVEPNYLLNKEKKDVVLSNEDEREISKQQGLDLLENLSTVSLQGSPSDVNTFEESQLSSSYSVHQESSDSSELPNSTMSQEADNIRISAESAIDTASNEAIYSEEKIWEQINALRTIVGYKAARKETCVEELKALYLVTGIEPPASFKETCDLAEVDAKLGFLKSVVGVK